MRYVPYAPPGIPTIDRPPMSADPTSSSSLSAELRLYRADNFRSYGDFLSHLASPLNGPTNQSLMSGPASQGHNRRSSIDESDCIPTFTSPRTSRSDATAITTGKLSNI